MNFRFFIICIILIIIQSVILLADLGLLPFQLFHSDADKAVQNQIGYIKEYQNDVKLKGHQQILWDKAEEKNKLFALDKVLTNENSSINLEFNNGAEIKVSEQTLLVIQDPEIQTDNGISISFNYGQFDAKTQLSSLDISNGDMKFTLNKDSKVRFHADQNKEMVITVDQGELDITSEGTTKKIKKDSKVYINKDQKIKTLKISNHLKWKTKSKTIYSHKFPVTTHVKWQGEAERFKTLKPAKSEKSVETSSNHKELNLMPGHYLFALEKSNNTTSDYLDITVKPAPKIFY